MVVSGRFSMVNNSSKLVRKATFITSLTTLRTPIKSFYNHQEEMIRNSIGNLIIYGNIPSIATHPLKKQDSLEYFSVLFQFDIDITQTQNNVRDSHHNA